MSDSKGTSEGRTLHLFGFDILSILRAIWFNVYAIFAAFTTYFCMYAFRKPFAAASYEGTKFLGSEIDAKTAFVIAQIIGYTISKFAGMKICSETGREGRGGLLVKLILAAWASLVLFAVLPQNLKVLIGMDKY